MFWGRRDPIVYKEKGNFLGACNGKHVYNLVVYIFLYVSIYLPRLLNLEYTTHNEVRCFLCVNVLWGGRKEFDRQKTLIKLEWGFYEPKMGTHM